MSIIVPGAVSVVEEIISTAVLAEKFDVIGVCLSENKIKIIISECTDVYASEIDLYIKIDDNSQFKFERRASAEMILQVKCQEILTRLNGIDHVSFVHV